MCKTLKFLNLFSKKKFGKGKRGAASERFFKEGNESRGMSESGSFGTTAPADGPNPSRAGTCTSSSLES